MYYYHIQLYTGVKPFAIFHLKKNPKLTGLGKPAAIHKFFSKHFADLQSLYAIFSQAVKTALSNP